MTGSTGLDLFTPNNAPVPLGDPTAEQGKSGTQSFGGFISVGETNPKLVGQERYRTAADILNNFSMVVAGWRTFQTLVSMPAWTVVPAKDINDGKDSSDDAKRAAAFMQSVMEGTDISWQRIVRRGTMYRFHGFGVHEWTAMRRPDGRIGIKAIEMRPCHTIYRWLLDENRHVKGVIQRVPDHMAEIVISRQKFIHLVDDGMTDSPEGLGLWRNLAEPWDRMKEYLRLEGLGFERDLRGIPFGKAPLSDMDAAVESGQMTKEQKTAMLKGFVDFIKMRSKSSDTGLVADSAVYEGMTDGGNTVSTTPKWDMKLLTAGSTSLADIGKAIERLRYETAMILGMDHLLLGSTASGSRALSNTKAQNLAMIINSAAQDISSTFSHDLIDAVWMLNGFPDHLKPKFMPEDASFRDITMVTQALVNMKNAGAPVLPGDAAVNAVRDIAGLPHAIESQLNAMENGDPVTPVTPAAPIVPRPAQASPAPSPTAQS